VVADGFSQRYGDLLYGSYDCVDRIVLNAYHTLGYQPGGFRTWWRRLHGDDDQLDNAHLMRMAGRFARRVRASAGAHGIPVIDCKRGERKHQIAEEYLAEHTVERGVFLILVSRAIAPVWEATRSTGGVLCNLTKKRAFVNHYSFHIMDPEWGHMTIKMSGHPPFGAQIILNGHGYVAATAHASGIGYVKEGNCFTRIADPAALAQIADTLSQPATIGRLTQVCDRWIYTACLCFGLDIDEQQRSGFSYGYSVYQAEYSRNLMFTIGAQMDQVFDRVVDRTRSRLDVPILRTLFGTKQRPGRNGTPDLSLRLAAVIETPQYDLTLFKVHFGNLTLKAYTKGEHVLRFEAIVHNTRALRCGRVLDNFPTIIGKLASMVDRFTTTLDCVDHTFIADDLLDRLPTPAQIGTSRVGGIDLNRPRIRDALSAVLALSATSGGFTVAEFTTKVHTLTGHTSYTIRQAAYDLRKLRGKDLITKPGRTRRYHITPHTAGTIAALLTLREQVIGPILAGVRSPRMGRKPITWTSVDRDYEKIRIDMQTLFGHLGIRAAG
jgi:hypothetical protein